MGCVQKAQPVKIKAASSSMYDAANQRVSGVRNDLRIKEIELKPRESGAFLLAPGAPLAWAVKHYYASKK